MGIRLPMPGLERTLGHLPPGSVILLEGGVDQAKDVFARELGKALVTEGRPLVYATTREGVDVTARLGRGRVHVLPARKWEDLPSPDPDVPGDLFVDDLGMVAMDAPQDALRTWLECLLVHCRATDAIAVLVLEDGLLDGRSAVLLRHLADGVIQFRTAEAADSMQTFLCILKWPAGAGRPVKLLYGQEAGRLVLDTRQRHA